MGELQLVAINHRYSATVSGEIRPFKVLTSTGIYYGENVKNGYSKSTSIKIFDDKFNELMRLVDKGD
jgi:hypothetical protein